MRVKVLRGPLAVGFSFYQNGEEVEVKDEFGKLLVGVGRVSQVVPEPQKRRRVYRRRDAKPGETAVMTAIAADSDSE